MQWQVAEETLYVEIYLVCSVFEQLDEQCQTMIGLGFVKRSDRVLRVIIERAPHP
jgi:hypothetical protein